MNDTDRCVHMHDHGWATMPWRLVGEDRYEVLLNGTWRPVEPGEAPPHLRTQPITQKAHRASLTPQDGPRGRSLDDLLHDAFFAGAQAAWDRVGTTMPTQTAFERWRSNLTRG